MSIQRWWTSIDRGLLTASIFLAICGALFAISTTQAIAYRIGQWYFYLAYKQVFHSIAAVICMLVISTLEPKKIFHAVKIATVICVVGLILLLIVGNKINGAKRWFSVMGMSFQPSEFIKPLFALANAMWLYYNTEKLQRAVIISLLMCFFIVILLLLEPDVGSSIVVVSICCCQLFIAGWAQRNLFIAGILGLCILPILYLLLPHFALRINQFFFSEEMHEQVATALKAFKSGSIFGVGAGEGRVKLYLPDAHSDFIFAAICEEFGAVTCLILLWILSYILYKCAVHVTRERNILYIFAMSGMALHFGIQTLINTASSLHLIPTKGMTLPMISYGGSSTIAFACELGIILAITRRRILNHDVIYEEHTINYEK